MPLVHSDYLDVSDTDIAVDSLLIQPMRCQHTDHTCDVSPPSKIPERTQPDKSMHKHLRSMSNRYITYVPICLKFGVDATQTRYNRAELV